MSIKYSRESNPEDYKCIQCGSPLGFEPSFCCNAYDCGCQGLPTEPPVCSEECYNKFLYPNKTIMNLSDYKTKTIFATDKITGFTGQVIGHADYITGCDQYLVQPPVKDGEFKDSRWIDEGRLYTNVDSLDDDPDVQTEAPGADKPAPIK